MKGRDVYITWDGGQVYLRGRSPEKRGLFVSGDGIDGWDSSPETKVSMTERQTGDGAHDVEESSVLYASRTVTISFHAHGADRAEVLGLLEGLNASCHKIVTLRIVDADRDTWAKGYVSTVIEPEWLNGEWSTGEITVVCADPRRYSTECHSLQLFPNGTSDGGLVFSDGLMFDMRYGGASTIQNVASLSNAGNSAAYPILTINGTMDEGAAIDWDDGSRTGRLQYGQPVGYVPVKLDCLRKTANVAGLDVTRNLDSRSFPSIPAKGSARINLQATGAGWLSVEWRDTYI